MSKKTWKLTIFLIKETIVDYQSALDPHKPLAVTPIVQQAGWEGVLYLGNQRRGEPEWIGLVNKLLPSPVQGISAGISAVLMVKVSGRIFAICFGQGRTFLNPRAIVRGFGLRVTLNRVDPDKLRGIESRIYEELVVSGRKQTSRSAALSAFNIDVARDLVKAVSGQTHDKTFFSHLAGADSLMATTELPISALGDLCDETLIAFADTAYQKNFKFIDYVQLERDPDTVSALDAELVNALNSNPQSVHFAAPDVLDWSAPLRFKYTGGKKLFYNELLTAEYLQANPVVIDVEQLHRHLVSAYRDGEINPFDRWSIYDCVVCELDLLGRRYVLLDGSWFQVDLGFSSEVLAEVNRLPHLSLPFPTAKTGMSEGDYNRLLALSSPLTFALMDQKLFKAVGYASPIEFCDILTTSKHLVHIKRRNGSATLSHLFAQGSVSGEAFLRDDSLRREIAKHLNTNGLFGHSAIIPKIRPSSGEFYVVFCIIARKTSGLWPPPWPFFSAVNLAHHARRLENQGFKVGLQFVEAK